MISAASARLAGNGTQLRRKRIDDIEIEYALQLVVLLVRWPSSLVLNRYRVRAM